MNQQPKIRIVEFTFPDISTDTIEKLPETDSEGICVIFQHDTSTSKDIVVKLIQKGVTLILIKQESDYKIYIKKETSYRPGSLDQLPKTENVEKLKGYLTKYITRAHKSSGPAGTNGNGKNKRKISKTKDGTSANGAGAAADWTDTPKTKQEEEEAIMAAAVLVQLSNRKNKKTKY